PVRRCSRRTKNSRKQPPVAAPRSSGRDLASATRAAPDPHTGALLLRPAFENAVAAGFLKGLIPVPFGGAASSGVDAAIFVEEWAAESPDFVISMAGPLIALAPVYQVGTLEQVERFVRPFLADS